MPEAGRSSFSGLNRRSAGLMDGSLSTLAPIFAVVLATHEPLTAFYTSLATARWARA
jgi:hypothetical protein